MAVLQPNNIDPELKLKRTKEPWPPEISGDTVQRCYESGAKLEFFGGAMIEGLRRQELHAI